MGKLMDRLQKQLKIPEHKKNAEDCIKVYNWIKDTDPEGRVWDSRWRHLINVKFKDFPSDERTFSLNITGKMLLKGITKEE